MRIDLDAISLYIVLGCSIFFALVDKITWGEHMIVFAICIAALALKNKK